MSNKAGRCKACHHPPGPLLGRASKAICACTCHVGVPVPTAIHFDFWVPSDSTPVTEAVDEWLRRFAKPETQIKVSTAAYLRQRAREVGRA